MQSPTSHQFSKVPNVEILRSSFDRSHGYKTTFDAGWLIPIFFDEALPGDTFNCRMTGFARLATPLKPLMDNLHMETFFFAVPYRLLWDEWEQFNGQRDRPNDDVSDLQTPKVDFTGGGNESGSIADYFGIPLSSSVVTPPSVCAFHFRAYNLIWNEWFRDENIQEPVVVDTTGGWDQGTTYKLLRRGKRHDYFTSCLPWPQKGEDVTVPLGSFAPVVPDFNGKPLFTNYKGGSSSRALMMQDTSETVEWSTIPPGNAQAHWSDPGLVADLSAVESGWTINQMRQAFQTQKMLERDARGGTRYTEVIRSHFGVTSPDARLQRPEFLGGGTSRVNITPVEQNTPGEPLASPQGNLAAFGTAHLSNHGFTKSFTEHCVILGLISVRADITYQQGLNRMWSRDFRFDYYWPSLAQLGEQAVLSQELCYTGNASDDDVFGYQERYAEYRYKPSMITGKFRSDTPLGSLDIWHLAQDFSAPPTLSEEFIQDNPPVDRVIAVQSEPHFLFDSIFNLKCARPMPLYGVPGNMDRF